MGLPTDQQMTLRRGERRLNEKLVSLGLSRTCCHALFLDFHPHAACSRSSFLPFSPPPPALHPCEMRAIARSRDQQANLRARRGPLGNHTDTHPTASMIFSRSKCGHTTRRRWRRHTHTHRIAPPLPFAAPCLLPPSFPQDGMEARDWEA